MKKVINEVFYQNVSFGNYGCHVGMGHVTLEWESTVVYPRLLFLAIAIEDGHLLPEAADFSGSKVPYEVVCLFWQKDKLLHGEPLVPRKIGNLGLQCPPLIDG